LGPIGPNCNGGQSEIGGRSSSFWCGERTEGFWGLGRISQRGFKRESLIIVLNLQKGDEISLKGFHWEIHLKRSRLGHPGVNGGLKPTPEKGSQN